MPAIEASADIEGQPRFYRCLQANRRDASSLLRDGEFPSAKLTSQEGEHYCVWSADSPSSNAALRARPQR